jgi:cell division protein FtsQ
MRRVKPARSLDTAKALLLRRRLHRYLPRRPRLVLSAVGGLALLGVAALAAVDLFDHGSRLRDLALAGTGRLGLTIQDIEVEGRSVTPRDEILSAIGAGRGTPILGVDPARVKRDLESLPWIRTASVERKLPDTLYIRLIERQPLALWQHQGKMALIDQDGAVVENAPLERYADLLLVVGDDAPKNAGALIPILETQPDLMHRVTAAVRVAERRWNLELDNSITVELPETDIADAWTRLGRIDQEHALLARDIDQVDLRLADRVVVRAVPEPPKPAAPGKHAKTAAKT